MVDGVILRRSGGRLAVISFALLGLFVLKSILSTAGSYLFQWTGESIAADLRFKIYTRLHDCHLSSLLSEPIGESTSRLSNDVTSIRYAVTDSSASWVVALASLLGSLLAMLYINRILTAVIMVAIPFTGLIATAVSSRLQALGRRLQDAFARTVSIAEEALTAALIVKSFVREAFECARYRSAVQKYLDTARNNALMSSSFQEMIQLTCCAAMVLVFWFGGREALAGKLTPGDLVAFLFLSQNIADSVSVLSGVYTTLNRSVGAVERVSSVFIAPSENISRSKGEVLKDVQGQIIVENVTYSYNSAPILRNVYLSIMPGQVVAIVGRSGAGKSTLAKLLCRLYDVDDGRILLDGRDIRTLTLDFLRNQIAFVPQDGTLFTTTISENIKYGKLDATDQEVEDAARAANAEAFILNLPSGYKTIVDPHGSNLSGGERQRLAIARAFIKKCPVLLLDEPTSSMDSASEALIQKAIEKRMRGRTIITIAHRLATVRSADQIFVLDGGRIVERGCHESLMRGHGLYAELAYKQLVAD